MSQVSQGGAILSHLSQDGTEGWHVPNRLADHLRWGDPKPESPDLEAVMRRQGRAAAILRHLAQDPDVHFLPLVRHVCRPECRVMSGGRPLYADDDHMSVHGALEVLAPLLEGTIWRSADNPHQFG